MCYKATDMQFRLISILLLLAITSLNAEEKWLRLRTPNFEIYTPQNEKKAREIALYFEQLREFFLNYWKVETAPGTPVRIVLFGNEKQYDPFRPHKTTAGYFSHGIDRDWIVIGAHQQGWERIVCHEYTHLMVKQAGLDLPTWLNEGLAEIYSTFKPIDGKVQVGDLIPEHFYAIQSAWIPVDRILEVNQESPEYNGKNTAQFYAGSWGLTHMLMLSQQDRNLYGALLEKLAIGTPYAAALESTGLTTKRLDGDLRNYLKQNTRFYGGVIPFKSQKSTASWTSAPVPPVEVDAILASLQSSNPAKADDAKARLARLNPADWHSQESMAYAAWRTGDTKTALTHFEKAITLGADNAKLYYDAARASMYSGEKSKDSVTHLKKAIELYPLWAEARLQLLEQFNYLGRYSEALSLATEFKRITPNLASRLFRGMAYTEAMLSAPDRAAQTAKRARDNAHTAFDKLECERLDSFMTSLTASRQSEAQRGETLARAIRDARERADKEESVGYSGGISNPYIPVLAEAKYIDLVGTLHNIQCEGPHPILRVTTESGEKIELQILDPAMVNVQMLKPGEKQQDLELNCGDQSRKVKISYLPPAKEGKLGELRLIQYL